MSLRDLSLAQLAYANVGVGPTKTAQPDNPITTPNGAPAADGDGVDVEDGVFAVVRVNPTGGSPSFRVWSRGTNETNEFSLLNNLEDLTITDGRPWKEIVFVGPEAELFVEVTAMGGASSVDIEISPCGG